MTPEGRVKKLVRARLDARKPLIFYDMPVPAGFGKSTLDFIGCYYGRYFAIETKAPGKRLRSRQEGVRDDMIAAGGVVFEIDGEAGLVGLDAWLDHVEQNQ